MEFIFRAWNKSQKKMFSHKDISVLAKNMKNDNIWVYMQYTGIYDILGKPLFIGDIIRQNDDDFGGYDRTEHQVVVDMHCYDIIYSKEHSGLWSWDRFTIVGNVFENPDVCNNNYAYAVGYEQERVAGDKNIINTYF